MGGWRRYQTFRNKLPKTAKMSQTTNYARTWQAWPCDRSCPVCGLTYVRESEEDRRLHRARHRKVLQVYEPKPERGWPRSIPGMGSSCRSMVTESDYSTNRAFVLAIEAARLLCAGGQTGGLAARLMRRAINEIEAVCGPRGCRGPHRRASTQSKPERS